MRAGPATPDLTPEAVTEWLGKLPKDLRAAVGDTPPPRNPEVAALCSAVAEAPKTQLPELIESNSGVLKEIGRPSRVRLLAWLSNQVHEFEPEIFQSVVSDTDEGGGSRETGVLFLEDIRALAEIALSQRAAARLASINTLGVVRSVSLEAASPAFKENM